MMVMDFSSGAGQTTGFDVIPRGQLAWAICDVRGLKNGPTGSQYLDCEFTICDNQPYARRKVFEKIGDPNFAGNSENYRQMGMVAITRMLEAGRGAGPNNQAAYQLQQYKDLSGLRVAIKIGIEEGNGGYDDKNRVADFLTPNPQSQSGHKGFLKLQAGEFSPGGGQDQQQSASGFGAQGGQQAQQVQSGFGFGGQGGQQQQPSQQGGFGQATQQQQPGQQSQNGFGGQTQDNASGFQQPQPQGQDQWGGAQAAAGQQTQDQGSATTTTATDQSRSDPTSAPSWLQQAGDQAQ